jgi:hypothetical protein
MIPAAHDWGEHYIFFFFRTIVSVISATLVGLRFERIKGKKENFYKLFNMENAVVPGAFRPPLFC